MTRPRLAPSLVASMLSLGAWSCAPSFESLVASRRYDDAICHARSQAEASALASAIERDADVRWHVYVAHDRELEASLGELGKKLSSQVSLVRVKAGSNELPSRSTMSVDLVNPDEGSQGKVVSLMPWGHPGDDDALVLFGLTGERLPGSRTVIDTDKLQREIGWFVFTVGLKQLLFGADKIAHDAPPDRDSYLRSGPRAMAVYDALTRGGETRGFLVPRSREQGVRLRASLELQTSSEDDQPCRLTIEYATPLAARGERLVDAVDRAFGAQARRPSELGSSSSFRLSNPRGSFASSAAR